MDLGELAAWQLRDYGMYHQTRRNLLVHIVAVPLFLLGSTLVLVCLLIQAWVAAAAFLVLAIVAFAAQGIGHSKEPIPPVPFSGPGNAVTRIVLEQWVTFPRFVLSGEWAENLRRARRPSGSPA